MNEKILIVDDEKEITDLLEIFLQNESYQIFKAYSLQDAIELIKNESFDLAIIDIMLPDGSGFDLCKFIREKYTYPIIMLTSRTEGMDRVTGLSLGADDYVTKPFLPIEKSVSIASEERTLLEFEITPDTCIYSCYDKIYYFFSSISGEHKRYEQVSYDNFISQKSKTLSKDNNIIIWSSDKKQIDHLVIIEWVE